MKGIRITLSVMTAALLFVFIFSSTLSADTVYYADGGVQEGKVVFESSTEVWIEVATSTGKATVKVPRSSVTRIVRGETLAEKLEATYFSKEMAMDAGKPAEWYRLGLWCEQYPTLTMRAKRAFERAVELDPDYAPAQMKLGKVKYEGVWMTYDEMMLARGYVKYKGEWVTVEGKVDLMLKDKELEIERERRAATEAAARRADYERQLAEKAAAAQAKPVEKTVIENRIVVEERIMSPAYYVYPARYYTYPVGAYPHPYYIRYPYRSGYRPPTPCSGVSVHYTRQTSNSAVRVGFFFR